MTTTIPGARTGGAKLPSFHEVPRGDGALLLLGEARTFAVEGAEVRKAVLFTS